LALEGLALPSTIKVITVAIQFFQQLLLLVAVAVEQIQLPQAKPVGAVAAGDILEVLGLEVRERPIKVMLVEQIELLAHIHLAAAAVRGLLAEQVQPLIQQEAVEMELHLA